jgi:hypothetical protein
MVHALLAGREFADIVDAPDRHIGAIDENPRTRRGSVVSIVVVQHVL